MYGKDDGAVIVSVFQDSDPQPLSGQRRKQGVEQGMEQEASRQYRGGEKLVKGGRREGGSILRLIRRGGGGLK